MHPAIENLSQADRRLLFSIIGYLEVSGEPSVSLSKLPSPRGTDLESVLQAGKDARLFKVEDDTLFRLRKKASITDKTPAPPSVSAMCSRFYAAHFRIRSLRPSKSSWDYATMRKLCRDYTWQAVQDAVIPFLNATRDQSSISDFARHLSKTYDNNSSAQG